MYIAYTLNKWGKLVNVQSVWLITTLFTRRSAHSIRGRIFEGSSVLLSNNKTALESFYLSDFGIRSKLGCAGNSGSGKSKPGRGKGKISEQDKEEGVA